MVGSNCIVDGTHGGTKNDGLTAHTKYTRRQVATRMTSVEARRLARVVAAD